MLFLECYDAIQVVFQGLFECCFKCCFKDCLKTISAVWMLFQRLFLEGDCNFLELFGGQFKGMNAKYS